MKTMKWRNLLKTEVVFLKQEIELKLAIEPQAIEKLINSSFFRQLQGRQQQKQLENTYYDTADWSLQHEKIALRIRKDGEAFIQTLKTKGKSDRGLHKRLEWEWPLAEHRLDTELIPIDHWPMHIQFSCLLPMFKTNFERRIWVFKHSDNQGNTAEIEMALDRGFISAEQTTKTIEICELELELISGDAELLQQVANLLTAECPSLTPCDVSKAARGFALLQSTD